MKRNARRVLFVNLDGTVADNAGALRAAFDRFAATYDAPASDELYAAASSQSLPMAVAMLKRHWSLRLSFDELLRRYSGLIDEAFLDVEPARGAVATLETACRNGWAVGIVTGNTGARTNGWLARTRLAAFVDIVVGGDEVVLSKPEPEPYRIALARSGCARELSTAVEASPNGARSALAAGTRTYGIAPDGSAALDWPETVRLIGALVEVIPELERQRVRRTVGRR